MTIPSWPPVHHQMLAPTAPPQTLFGLSYTQLEAFATATIAVLTLVYIIVAFCQWLAMRAALRQTRISNDATKESNRIAAESAELENRAWLVAMPLPLPQVTAQTTTAHIRVTNVGHIPATSVIVRAFGAISPGPDVPDVIVPVENQNPGICTLAPGNHVLNSAAPLHGISEENLVAAHEGTKTLFVYCDISYTDWFKKPRRTIACSYYRFDHNAWATAPKHDRLD
jgi:hypothetical protein